MLLRIDLRNEIQLGRGRGAAEQRPLLGRGTAQRLAEPWLASRPTDITAWRALGDTQFVSGNLAGARRSYESLLKLRPTDAEVLNNLAHVMLAQGMRDRRVSPEHLRAMRRALDAVDKPYQGYFPSDETHGFYDDETRRKYYQTVLWFLDVELKR